MKPEDIKVSMTFARREAASNAIAEAAVLISPMPIPFLRPKHAKARKDEAA